MKLRFRIAEPGSCCQQGDKPRSDSWFGDAKSSGGYGGLNSQEGLQEEEAIEPWKEGLRKQRWGGQEGLCVCVFVLQVRECGRVCSIIFQQNDSQSIM